MLTDHTPRTASPRSHSPSKSPMKSLLFGENARHGTRTRRPARSPRTEQEEGAGDAYVPRLGLSSKNAFSAAPRIVSMSRGASAETKVETTTKPPELESMTKKFCVKCGNLMGVEYQFCQVSVKDRHALSVAIWTVGVRVANIPCRPLGFSDSEPNPRLSLRGCLSTRNAGAHARSCHRGRPLHLKGVFQQQRPHLQIHPIGAFHRHRRQLCPCRTHKRQMQAGSTVR